MKTLSNFDMKKQVISALQKTIKEIDKSEFIIDAELNIIA